MLSENLENTDADVFLTGSTMVTNVLEHSDHDTLSFGTSETRVIENSDQDGIHMFFDTTMITKTLESTDAEY